MNFFLMIADANNKFKASWNAMSKHGNRKETVTQLHNQLIIEERNKNF